MQVKGRGELQRGRIYVGYPPVSLPRFDLDSSRDRMAPMSSERAGEEDPVGSRKRDSDLPWLLLSTLLGK